MEDLAGKAVLITGASTGIGAGAARAFGAHKARVVVHYNRSRAEAETVAADVRAAGGQAALVGGDLTDGAAVKRIGAEALAAFGRIDVLINNAGHMVARSLITEATDALFDHIVKLNAWSVVAMCREIVPAMRRHGGGAIINLSSITARNGGSLGAGLYAGTKAFVAAITKNLAKELVKDKIRVNAVSPGVIATPLHDKLTPPATMEAFRATIPMDRIGTPDDCAGAFLYLASDRLSGYVTGQIIEVNGGQYMP
ncbi:MAG: glucose 1-dehydrogenase [Alphaproteobacteria bacterium]|nr:glucose 1-dehydrogenase [Alphaproteobacteria bacterium]